MHSKLSCFENIFLRLLGFLVTIALLCAMNNEELKNLRQKYNLTQEEVAESVGTVKQRVSEWENGRKSISPAYQRLLIEYFRKISE